MRDEEFDNRVIWVKDEIFEVNKNTKNPFYIVTTYDGLQYAVNKDLDGKYYEIIEE